jgi:peptidoglycan/xylan/chitin deacetylase (PgdA/CDA1 family)
MTISDHGRRWRPSPGPHPLLPECAGAEVRFDANFQPRILVIVDAEEEFDWNAPFSRNNVSVTTVAAQRQAHSIFASYGIVPTYAVDYAIASQRSAFEPLRELLSTGGCDIGAQLHPWVTPPHQEEVSERNSYANNLPASLERQKIMVLTETIERNLGKRPRLYRAGRYGAGAVTLGILEELGYEIDCSVLPGERLHQFAPNYAGAPCYPYWLNSPRDVLEIPVTVGTVGWTGAVGETVYRRVSSGIGMRLRLPAIAARLGMVERIRLTPEGSTLAECMRLTRSMLQKGHRVFVVSYHSPSLEPGHTPYVRDASDLEKFLSWLKGYFDFFIGRLGGVPSTPAEIRTMALKRKTPVTAN